MFIEVYNDHLAHFLTACYYPIRGGQKGVFQQLKIGLLCYACCLIFSVRISTPVISAPFNRHCSVHAETCLFVNMEAHLHFHALIYYKTKLDIWKI